MFRLWIASAALGLGLLLAPAGVADTPRLIEKTSAKEPTTDKEFLIWAISCEMAEVQIGEKAMKNARNNDVRDLAVDVVQKHKAHRDALLENAKAQKLAVASGLEKHHREAFNRLSRLEGNDFDRAYDKYLIEGHAKGIEMYEKWQKHTTDAALKKEIEQILPSLRKHLAEARKIEKKLGS